jgi:Tol biopolymer transport system component
LPTILPDLLMTVRCQMKVVPRPDPPLFLSLAFLCLLTAPIPAMAPQGAGGDDIAFVSMRDGIEDIYVMRPDGSGVRRVTVTEMVEGEERGSWTPAWSPDRRRIVFASNRDDGGSANLYVVDADGRNLVRLTDHGQLDYSPDWSPDGTRIVFLSDRDGFYELYAMDADGANVERLTHLEKGQNGLCCPDWSPDGTLILFMVLNPPRTAVVQALDLTSGEMSSPGLGALPRWSPDGTQVAFFGAGMQVHVMNADGSGRRQVSDVPGLATYPSWSPDGEWIVFNHVPSIGDYEGTELFIVRPNGQDQRQLTQNEVMDGHPAWW